MEHKNKIVYLGFKRGDGQEIYNRYKKYVNDLGSLVSFSLGGKYACVTTTMNCLKVNGWEDDLDYKFDEPTYHQKPTNLMLNFYKEK